jgi:asparagine synthase (glutamine-hydrolysing)
VTLLGGVCRFDELLDVARICARIETDQGIAGGFKRSCEGACFTATLETGITLQARARILLAADVRLDNRSEIIAALGMSNERSDADLLLTAFSRLGATSLNLIVGDFALALFDCEQRKLTLVRDSAGQRPLFYRFGARGAAFASLPQALRSLGKAPPDLQALADQLLNINGPRLTSFFTDIHCVGVGEIVEIDPFGRTVRNWWTPRTDCDDFARDFPDPVETYRALLDDAVRCRTNSSSSVATHLSSGYDSSAVTATAARLAKQPEDVVAFTSVPVAGFQSPHIEGRIADEYSGAALVAARYGLRHVRVPPRKNVLGFIRGFGARIHQPILAPINISWWTDIRERAKGLGAEHILTGQNGNLSVSAGGYAAFSDYVLRNDWTGLLREMRAGMRRDDMSVRGVLYNSFVPWLPRGIANRLRLMIMESSLDNDFIRAAWCDPDRIAVAEAAIPRTYAARRIYSYRTEDSAVLAKSALLDHGIIENDPTSDRRMVEFSLRWPPEKLLFQGKSRSLARAGLADRLPAELLDSPVRGLQSADWHLHVSQAQARDLIADMRGNANAESLLNLDVMSEAIDRWPDRDLDNREVQFRYGIQLVSALMAGLFLIQHSSHPYDNSPSILGHS